MPSGLIVTMWVSNGSYLVSLVVVKVITPWERVENVDPVWFCFPLLNPVSFCWSSLKSVEAVLCCHCSSFVTYQLYPLMEFCPGWDCLTPNSFFSTFFGEGGGINGAGGVCAL